MRTALTAGALLVAGCTQPAPGVSDAGARTTPRLSAAPAPTDAADGGLVARSLPRIEHLGGAFVEHPRVVTVTFTKDDPQVVARLERFAAVIPSSAWWKTVTEGYCSKEGSCVGEGTAGTPVHLDDSLAAETRPAEIETLLQRNAKAGKLGSLDGRAVLLVYLPKGVALVGEGGERYCSGGPRALHRSIDLEGTRIAFAMLPRCEGEAEVTGVASHELLEATTNPLPATRGFAFRGGSQQSGFTAAGVEPVDPCGLVNMDGHWTTEAGFSVQRAWSNAAAAKAQNPCVPAPRDSRYALLVPREPAVRLAKDGDTVTLTADASSASDLPSWVVSAFDVTGEQNRDRYVDVSLDTASVKNGQSVAVTITAKKRSPSGRVVVGLVSTVGLHSHMWPLLVLMR